MCTDGKREKVLVKKGGENNKNNFAAHKVFLIFLGGGEGRLCQNYRSFSAFLVEL